MPELPFSWRWPAAIAIAVAVCAWAAHDVALNNYDTAYALLWGRDLAGGHLPDYSVALAPTPHPLAALFGAVISLPGRGAAPSSETQVWIWMTLAYASMLALGWLVFALGRAWFGTAAGVLAALIVLTREPLLSYGLRAYVDIPYLCLLLGALLVETRRPRAGTPVLVLLTLAGLLRPEAWLFAMLYGAWLWHGKALRRGHVALVFAAPALWALSDLLVAGDPLHSLTGTREGAKELARKTGLANVITLTPRRLGEIVREPVLLAAVGGLGFTLWRMPRRAALGVAGLLAALVAFAVLGTAGLSIITRYLLLAGTLLAIFAGAGIFGWLQIDRDDPARRWWAIFAAIAAVVLIAFIPQQANRIERLDAALDRQNAILVELRSLTSDPGETKGCKPMTLPNRRAVPQVALWTGLQPGEDILSGQDGGVRGLYFQPASQEIADDFVLDRRDADKRLPAPPAGIEPLRGRHWNLFVPANCP